MNCRPAVFSSLLVGCAVSAFAEEASTNGMLGERIVAADLVHGFPDGGGSAWGEDLLLNFPVVEWLDVGVAATHTQGRTDMDWSYNPEYRNWGANAYVTAYLPLDGAKPYVFGAIGYADSRVGIRMQDRYGESLGTLWWKEGSCAYAFGAGVEIPLGAATSFDVRAGRNERTESGWDSEWVATARANHWLNDRWAVYLLCTRNFGLDTSGIGAGLAMRY